MKDTRRQENAGDKGTDVEDRVPGGGDLVTSFLVRGQAWGKDGNSVSMSVLPMQESWVAARKWGTHCSLRTCQYSAPGYCTPSHPSLLAQPGDTRMEPSCKAHDHPQLLSPPAMP